MVKSIEKCQFGDFQTPDELAREVVKILKFKHKISPKFIIEPSCGKGAFIRASLNGFIDSIVIGLDITKIYRISKVVRVNAPKWGMLRSIKTRMANLIVSIN